MVDEFSKWQEIVETLYEGGMTGDPRVKAACEWFIRTNGDSSMLEELLSEYPSIFTEAKRNIMLDVNAKKENPFYPSPYGDEVEKLSKGIKVGRINKLGDMVGIDPLDFTRGLFICGAAGSGKSYPVFRMLKQILPVPKKERGFNVIIIQTSKQDMNFLFRDYTNLRILWTKDILYSPFNVEKWDTLDRKIASFVNVYQSVNWLRLHSLPMLNKAIDLAIEKNGYKDVNLEKVLDNVVEAANAISFTQGMSLKDTINHLGITLHNCISAGKLFNSYKGFPVDEFFSQEDLILNLYDFPNKYVIGTFLGTLLNDLKDYYISLSKPTALRTLVIIDECRSLFPKDPGGSSEGHNPNQAMENFVTTRRSSGIGLIAITQEPISVPTYLTSNSEFKLAMRIGGDARNDVKGLMNLNDDQTAFFDKLPKYGVGIMRHPDFDRPFWVKIPGDVDDSPIDEKAVKVMMEEYVTDLQSKYSAEPTIKEIEVHKEEIKPIRDWKADEKKSIAKANSFLIIRELVKNPFQNYTEVRSLTGLSAQRMKDSVDLLLAEGFAEQIVCIGSKGKKARYIVLTDKIPDRNMKNAFFFKHTLYEFRVMGFLKANGYSDIVREYFGNKKKGEKPSFINVTTRAGEKKTILKRIDVLGFRNGMKEAFEVTISFSNLVDNIHKCLEIFKVDFLTIVVEDNKEAKNIQKANILVKSRVPEVFHSRISLKLISDFCIAGNV